MESKTLILMATVLNSAYNKYKKKAKSDKEILLKMYSDINSIDNEIERKVGKKWMSWILSLKKDTAQPKSSKF